MRNTPYVWQIDTVRWYGRKGKESQEYIVASTFEQVLEYLKADRQDLGVEIKSISQKVPILKVYK